MVYHLRRASFVRVTMNAAAEGSVSLVSVRLAQLRRVQVRAAPKNARMDLAAGVLSGFDDSAICWVDCDAVTCAGICDADGSCAPEANSDCDASCGSYCTDDRRH